MPKQGPDFSHVPRPLSPSFASLQVIALTLRSAASGTGIPPHGNGLLVLEHIAEEGERTLKLPSVDSLGSLAGVLERGAEVAAASPGGLCVVDRGGGVADLRCN